MTFKELKTEAKARGMTVRLIDGEYQVNNKGDREECAYYTNDIQDAASTMRLMAR